MAAKYPLVLGAVLAILLLVSQDVAHAEGGLLELFVANKISIAS
jgi:hypothetical protein